MGRKILQVTGELLAGLFKVGTVNYLVKQGLPQDAIVVDCCMKWGSEPIIDLVVQSSEYPETTGTLEIMDPVWVTTLQTKIDRMLTQQETSTPKAPIPEEYVGDFEEGTHLGVGYLFQKVNEAKRKAELELVHKAEDVNVGWVGHRQIASCCASSGKMLMMEAYLMSYDQEKVTCPECLGLAISASELQAGITALNDYYDTRDAKLAESTVVHKFFQGKEPLCSFISNSNLQNAKLSRNNGEVTCPDCQSTSERYRRYVAKKAKKFEETWIRKDQEKEDVLIRAYLKENTFANPIMSGPDCKVGFSSSESTDDLLATECPNCGKRHVGMCQQ